MYFFPGIVVSKSVLPRGLVRGNWHLPDMLVRPTKAHHGGVKEREANAAPQPAHDSGVWHREFCRKARGEALERDPV